MNEISNGDSTRNIKMILLNQITLRKSLLNFRHTTHSIGNVVSFYTTYDAKCTHNPLKFYYPLMLLVYISN